MAYEVDRLEIVIETATQKANIELDKLIAKLNIVSNSLKEVANAASQINRASDYIKKSTAAAEDSTQSLKKMGEAYKKVASSMTKDTSIETALANQGKGVESLKAKFAGLTPAFELLGTQLNYALREPPAMVKLTSTLDRLIYKFKDVGQELSQIGTRLQITESKTEAYYNSLKDFDGILNKTIASLENVRSATAAYEEVMVGVIDVGQESKEKQLEIAEAYKVVTQAVKEAAAAKKLLEASEGANQKGSAMSSLLGQDMNREIKKFNSEYSKSIATAKKLNEEMGKHKYEVSTTQGALLKLRRTMLNVISLVYVLKKGWSSVRRAMDFGETINLFQTVFRKIGMDAGKEFEFAFLNRAEEFSTKLAKNLALDPNDVMNYMANFAQMANSMGLVQESSYRISESLTMLGADVASLFNIDVDQAMTRLRAGLSGQIRPMRMMGVDISKTTLSMIALEHGITDSLESMSAAAKVQLRYLAMTKQLEVTMGDMARTMDTPANQLRIMKQQFENTSRAIGQVFIPILTKIFPIVNGLIMALGTFFSLLAGTAGYKDPDYKDQDIVLGDLEDAAEDADEALQNLRHTMGGFDELNILSSGGSANDLIGDSGYVELDEAVLKSNTRYTKVLQEQVDKMTNSAAMWQSKFETIIPIIVRLTAALVVLIATMKLLGTVSVGLIGFRNAGIAGLSEAIPIVGMFGKAFSGLKIALGALASPIGLIVIAVVALVALFAALYIKNEEFRDSINGLLLTFKPVVDSILGLLFKVFEAIKPLGPVFIELFHSVGNALASVINLLSPIISIFFRGVALAIDIIGAIAATLVKILTKIVTGVVKVISVVLDGFTVVLNFVTSIPDKIKSVYITLGQFFIGLWNGIVDNTRFIWEPVFEFFSDMFGAISNTVRLFAEFFKTVFMGIAIFFSGVWDNISELFSEIWRRFTGNISDFGTKFKNIFAGLTSFFVTIWEPISEFFNSIWTGMKSGINEFVKFFKKAFGGIVDSVMKPFKALQDMFKDIMSADSIGDIFKSLLNALIKGLNAVVTKPFDAINSILSKIKNINILGVKPFTWIKTVPVPKIPQLAEGGIVGHGQMFIANEAGPEMVGQFGSKTGVINNDQIVQAVSRGVAQAVAAVMGTQGQGTQNVNVFLDGRQITNAVTQNKNRRGVEISRGGNR